MLRGCQLVVEHNRVGINSQTGGFEFVDFSFADERCRVGFVAPLRESRHYVGPGGVDQSLEFVQTVAGFGIGATIKRHGHQHNFFANRALDERAAKRL